MAIFRASNLRQDQIGDDIRDIKHALSSAGIRLTDREDRYPLRLAPFQMAPKPNLKDIDDKLNKLLDYLKLEVHKPNSDTVIRKKPREIK